MESVITRRGRIGRRALKMVPQKGLIVGTLLQERVMVSGQLRRFGGGMRLRGAGNKASEKSELASS